MVPACIARHLTQSSNVSVELTHSLLATCADHSAHRPLLQGRDRQLEGMSLALAKAVIKKRGMLKPGSGSGSTAGGDDARELAAAMLVWLEDQLDEREGGGGGGGGQRVPKNKYCHKCGHALHSAATFCANCGFKLPREGDLEVGSLAFGSMGSSSPTHSLARSLFLLSARHGESARHDCVERGKKRREERTRACGSVACPS